MSTNTEFARAYLVRLAGGEDKVNTALIDVFAGILGRQIDANDGELPESFGVLSSIFGFVSTPADNREDGAAPTSNSDDETVNQTVEDVEKEDGLAPSAPDDNTGPTLSLTDALAADELPAEYTISDASVDFGTLAVAGVSASTAEAQTIIDGAANADELTLDATYTLEDSADVLLADENAQLVADAGTVTVTDETLTREQYDALSQLDNVDLEGVPVTDTDDAPEVTIAEANQGALLAADATVLSSVAEAEDVITDVDGFGGGATVTLAYADAVSASGEFGAPTFAANSDFSAVRDGESFTLIADAGTNGFDAATAIGSITPTGITLVEEDGQPDSYTQTGYTLELNENVTPDVLTALLQQWKVQQAADNSNTQLNVTIASDGGAEDVTFTQNIAGTEAGDVTLTGTETALEAELTAGGDLGTVNAEEAFAPFGDTVDFGGEVGLIEGMTFTLSSSNAADAFALADDNGFFEVVGGQLIVKADEITGGDDLVVGDVTGLGTSEVNVTFRDSLPAGFDQGDIDTLLKNLQLDLEDATGDRNVSLDVTSGDGLSEASLDRDISVLGEFSKVTLTEIADADATADPSTAVTIDGNTILDVANFDAELDVQAQIDAGNLVIDGDNPIRVTATEDANLSQVTGLDALGSLRIQEVAENKTLTLNASQVDFLSTAGAVDGNIAISGLEGNLDADLSGLEAANVTAGISEDAGEVTFTGNFGTAEVTVESGSTLSASAATLSGVSVTKIGAVVVTDLDGAAAYDLSKITETATATLAAGGVTTLNEETKLGDVAVTVPQNSGLVLTADQADGQTIEGGDVTGDGNKGGDITVLGLSDGADLSNISASNILAGAVSATNSDLIVSFRAEDEEADEGVITGANLGDFSVQVQEAATLRIDEKASEQVITGAGNVEVHVDTAGALDLSNVTVDGDKTVEVVSTIDLSGETVDFGDFDVNVAESAKLTLTAAQASGLTVIGEDADEANETAGGSIEVVLDGENAYYLSDITAGAGYSVEGEIREKGTLTATVASDTTLNEATDLGDFTLALSEVVDENVALTLAAAQATGREITGDNGDSVIVNALAADTDLSGIAAEIDTVTANVAESIDISANENLDNVTEFNVANDAVLTLSARQADEQTVNVDPKVPATDEAPAQAAGAVVVSGDLAAIDGGDNNIDLAKLPADVTFDGGSLVVGAGVTLALTAAQADGKVITGAGDVTVTDLGDTAVDLSGISVEGDKSAQVDSSLTLNTDTDLGDFDLEVTTGNTLTLTAAQANGLATLTGAGSAVINGTVAGETLDFSAWTVNELTINGGGGADVLTAPNGVDSVTLNGGSNADTFNVASGTVTIGDFTPGVDELVIGAEATAKITLTEDTDLTDTQVAGLIGNEGTLNVTLDGFQLTATEAQLDNITITDGSALVGGDLGVLTISEAKATDLADDAVYSLKGSAADMLDDSNSAVVAGATELRVTGTDNELSVDEYTELTGDGQGELGASFDAAAKYSLKDTAENLAAAGDDALNGATDITAEDAATVAQAETIADAVNNGDTTFSIADELDKVLAGAAKQAVADKNGLDEASSITVSDLTNGEEEVEFNNLDAASAATSIDFTDDAATLKFDEFNTITKSEEYDLSLTKADAITVTDVADITGLNAVVSALGNEGSVDDTISFAGGSFELTAVQLSNVAAKANLVDTDAITVTGVNNQAGLTNADAELSDNDIVEIDNGSIIALNVTQLNALTAKVTAEADAGSAGNTEITVDHGETAERGTDLVDTFSTKETANDTYIINADALENGDKVDLGASSVNAFSGGSEESSVEITADFDNGSNTTSFTVETEANGSADYTVKVVGMDLSSSDVTAGVIEIA